MLDDQWGQEGKGFAARDVLRRLKLHRVTLAAFVVGLLVVCGVGVGVFGWAMMMAKRKAVTTEAEMSKALSMVEAYAVRHSSNHIPYTLYSGYQSFGAVGQEGAVEQLDGWGQPLIYKRLSNHSFVLISCGPDGVEGTQDDIVRRREVAKPRGR